MFKKVIFVGICIISTTPCDSVASKPEEHIPAFSIIPGSTSLSGRFAGLPKDCKLSADDIQIGSFEVSNIEYTQFLNAVARFQDPFKLYSPLQGAHFWGGITRTERDGTFLYAVKPGYGNLPVTFVSAHDSIRFANWLHYGRPSNGKSQLGTTEGTFDTGAYDTRFLIGTAIGPRRNAGARYFLPSCGEWLLAGFFDPKTLELTEYSGGGTLPASADPGHIERAANYYAERWAVPFPHLAPVTAYATNQSALGTRNQAGNVMEWVEGSVGLNQLALGGSLFLPKDTLSKDYRDSELANEKISSFGFRIARAIAIGEVLRFSATATAIEVTAPPALESSSKSLSAWTTIDRPGNTSDYRTGFGCVASNFEISATEVTNEQYAEFLNSVADQLDTHSLWLPDMASGVNGGILRNATQSGETVKYDVKRGYETRPAAYLSWFTLARMANWYHFGQPKGTQVLGVTEGDNVTGAYDTRDFIAFEVKGERQTVEPSLLKRNNSAKYFLPTNDEWYKAAYYDPDKQSLLKYWSYPNRSDTPPENKANNRGTNYQTESLGEGTPYFLSRAGHFGSHGYYHIVDMGGNVWEWLESWRGLGGEPGWRGNIPTKGLRGGSYNYIDLGLAYSNIDPGYPSDHYFVYGGRLARRLSIDDSGYCFPPGVRSGVSRTLRFTITYRTHLAIGAALTALCFIGWKSQRQRRA